ncbi:MAG: hypothetical protein ACYDB4_17835 [Candidatus Dormibacteraceae bacterium]
MSPIPAAVTDEVIQRAHAEQQDVIRLYEATSSELAGVTAELDQADARLGEMLAADVFADTAFTKAQAKADQLRQRRSTLQARVDALRRRGEEAESRRNELIAIRTRAEREAAIHELQAAITAANEGLIRSIKALWAATPQEVREMAGASVLHGGPMWVDYFSTMHGLRLQAELLGLGSPYVYGGGVISQMVSKGMLDESDPRLDPTAV